MATAGPDGSRRGLYTRETFLLTSEKTMAKLRVLCFGTSIDGFGAGPDQHSSNPLGGRGTELVSWVFATRFWNRMHGQDGGEAGIDNAMAEQGFTGIGAWILGRNMFGPVRGPWPDASWRGWWGDEPPCRSPVFVLPERRS